MRRFISLIVISLIVGLTVSSTQGKTIHVKVGGTGDGSSWSNAYGSLQDALDSAEPNDRIWVAQGTYKPTQLYDPCDPRTATFQMKNGVGIYGGFPGVGDPNLESRDWEKYETVLSGDLLGNDVEVGDPLNLFNDPCRADNCFHVFYHPNDTNLDPNAVLDGFTITGGNNNGSGDNHRGSGMINISCSPTVTYCIFRGNGGGGMYNCQSSTKVSHCTFADNAPGMYNEQSGPTVTYCIFSHNHSWYGIGGWHGGGMVNLQSSSTKVSHCTFTGNMAGLTGGGMFNSSCSLTISHCTFNGNTAGWSGGGMCNYEESSMTITNCIFSGNTAGHFGGGMHNEYSSFLKISDCVFSNNMAADFGGGMNGTFGGFILIMDGCVFSNNMASYGGGLYVSYGGGSGSRVNRCNFRGNTASSSGGGILIIGCEWTITNCILNGNWASYGGGLYSESSTSNIVNCTFAENSATNGSTMAFDHTYLFDRSIVELLNCILWDGGDEIWNNDYSTITINYSDIQNGYPGIGNIDTDPLFIDPNGPDNIPGTEDDNLHLLPYSPCIDAGDPTGDYTNQTDIDGQERLLYDRVDIGADEVFPIAGDIDMDGDVDFKDYAYFCGHWLKGK